MNECYMLHDEKDISQSTTQQVASKQKKGRRKNQQGEERLPSHLHQYNDHHVAKNKKKLQNEREQHGKRTEQQTEL